MSGGHETVTETQDVSGNWSGTGLHGEVLLADPLPTNDRYRS